MAKVTGVEEVRKLKRRDATMWAMKLEGWSYKEIGDIFKISPQAVEDRLKKVARDRQVEIDTI